MFRIFFAVLLLPVSSANAGFDGRQFLPFCEQHKHEIACIMSTGSVYMGYMAGTADTISELDPLRYEKGVPEIEKVSEICMPAKVTNPQILDIVLHFIRNNPALQHQSITRLTIAAIKNAFPCY